ncbi:PDZ and LIM domain protein 5 isoform X3 [Chelonia mydas]|uniref:PDZ and LIM domain protein 5 isoform X3 n=1 Tax=Chelonia mydas TaxID=8469 RepID=UPI001CA90462|nr:PDZ and LIM domain protein 5 isoform X3 [Chelonia mydas]
MCNLLGQLSRPLTLPPRAPRCRLPGLPSLSAGARRTSPSLLGRGGGAERGGSENEPRGTQPQPLTRAASSVALAWASGSARRLQPPRHLPGIRPSASNTMSNYSVSLVGPAPWGFRLQGGKDFNMPLTISRLSDGGKAARAQVGIGDVVLTIDGTSTDGMTHLEAQNKIKACTGNLNMNLQRAHSAPKPDPVPVQKGEPKEVVKPVPIASAVAPKVTSTVNMAYNKTPRPFGAVSSSKVTSIPSPSSAFTPAHVTVPSCASPPPLTTVTPPPFIASGLHVNAKSSTDQRSPALNAAKAAVNVPWQPNTYNTTLNTYSNDNAQDVAEGQRRGFKESQVDNKQQNGKNPPKRPPRKHIVDTYTEFYHTPTHRDASKKRLIEDTEDWHPRTGTTQSRSFRILAQITGTEHMKEPETETTKKTKESQTENGDPSVSVDLPNGIEAQNSSLDLNKHSVATQTIEVTPASEPPSTPLPAMRPESTSDGSPLAKSSPVSVPSPRLPDHVSSSPQGRKLLFDNPLEALPKCAPHPPAVVQVLSVSSQVATVSKVASTYTRKITQSAELSAPGPASLMTNETDAESSLSDKHTVATQTSEPPLLTVASMEPPCAVQRVESIPSVLPVPVSFYTRKALPENPLEDLPKFSPIPVPSPSRQSSKVMSSAAAAVSAAVAVRARLSDPNVYRSLLDALLITPITKPPPLQSVRPSRKSTSALELQKKESDSLEASQPVAYAAASVRSMPVSPDKTDTKPAAANITSATAFKPTGPQSAVKYSGWQPSNQAAPTSGWISNNMTPSGATAPSDKSVTPPQLTEQDTLVQRAEHIPAGKRTPMCAQCNQVIRGPFLVALGKSWHPEEFNCAHCRTSMAYVGFVEEKGALYCEICYEKFFAPECSRCQRKILGITMPSLVPCAMAVNSPLKLETDFLKPWATPGTTPALCARSVVTVWRVRRSSLKRISPCARSMLTQ